MRKKILMLLVLLAAFALVAASCGSDGDDTETGDGGDTTAVATDDDTAEDDAMEDEDEGDAGEDDAMEDEDEGDAAPPVVAASASYTTSVVAVTSRSTTRRPRVSSGPRPSSAPRSPRRHPTMTGSNRGELLQLQADNSDIVIGVGFLFADSVREVAGDNPGVNFAVIDDAMLDFDNGAVPWGDNIAGLTFAEEQGSFLVGAAAALKSETGKVGFIGGVCCFGLIEKFEAGFIAGATAVNPDIEVVSQYITEFPDFDGFNAPDRARETSLAMFEDGADIVYHAAGGSGAGLFEAAKEYSEANDTKVWGIGVDSDQFNTVDPSVQEYVLTSMLKRVDVAVFEIIKAQSEGTFAAGNTVYDLSVDGVGYSTSGGFIDDIVPDLEDWKARIVSGEIEVPTEP